MKWLEDEARIIASLPRRIDTVLEKMEHGEMAVITKPSAELDKRLDGLSKGINRLAAAVIFAGLLVTGALFYLNGEPIFGLGFGICSILSLFWVLKG
jgi:hypothetical protein